MRTDRFGSFRKADFDPKVAANLVRERGKCLGHTKMKEKSPEEAKAAVAFHEQFWSEEHGRSRKGVKMGIPSWRPIKVDCGDYFRN